MLWPEFVPLPPSVGVFGDRSPWGCGFCKRSSEKFQGDLNQAEGEGILPTPGETEGHSSPRRARRLSPECGHPRDACAPEDPRPKSPRRPQARVEHAACSHEGPRPGVAGRPAVLGARSWPVVPGLHPDHQLQPLHPKAVPAVRHGVCQCPNHRSQQQQEGSLREQDVCLLLRLR
ncbi:lymphocyte antigen 6H isoform X1 [Symphalangus syndactylus]|uniref:lymphocyte antigen 6H isoform X1 n=1 Tax=Symphalangus syndactylus TaxID=9590 RepID=UPI002441B698|nr:lymphocyte antigen 6H isoform X1 [Symphalangus syndactylus]